MANQGINDSGDQLKALSISVADQVAAIVLSEYLATREREKNEMRVKIQHTKAMLAAYQAHLEKNRTVANSFRRDNQVIKKCAQLLREKLQSIKLKHADEEQHQLSLVTKYQDVFAKQYAIYESLPQRQQLTEQQRQLHQVEHQFMVKESQLEHFQNTARQLLFYRGTKGDEEHDFVKPNDVYVDLIRSARLKLNTEEVRQQMIKRKQDYRQPEVESVLKSQQKQHYFPESINESIVQEEGVPPSLFGFSQNIQTVDEEQAMEQESHKENKEGNRDEGNDKIPVAVTESPKAVTPLIQLTPTTPKPSPIPSRFTQMLMSPNLVAIRDRARTRAQEPESPRIVTTGDNLRSNSASSQKRVLVFDENENDAARPCPSATPKLVEDRSTPPVTPALSFPGQSGLVSPFIVPSGKTVTAAVMCSPLLTGFSNLEHDFASVFNSRQTNCATPTLNSGSPFKRPAAIPTRSIASHVSKETPMDTPTTSLNFLNVSIPNTSAISEPFFGGAHQPSLGMNFFGGSVESVGSQENDGSFLMNAGPPSAAVTDSPFLSFGMSNSEKPSTSMFW